MNYQKQNEKLASTARKLLLDKTVDLVLGFGENSETGSPTPLFIRNPEKVDELVWNSDCWRTLSPYLIGRSGKTALVAKPCDVRSVINLLSELQLERENIVIIGMQCNGMYKDGKLSAGCKTCSSSIPNIYDIPVGADGLSIYSENITSPKTTTASWLDTATIEERHEKFMAEMDKCILCYSCRQACPGCYCKTCFTDRNMTPWEPVDADTSAKTAFHITRAMHLAGRCVGCGACENVCPSGVDIKYLYDAMSDFLEELYDFRAGVSPDALPVMNDFSTDDREVGFLGGDTVDSN